MKDISLGLCFMITLTFVGCRPSQTSHLNEVGESISECVRLFLEETDQDPNQVMILTDGEYGSLDSFRTLYTGPILEDGIQVKTPLQEFPALRDHFHFGNYADHNPERVKQFHSTLELPIILMNPTRDAMVIHFSCICIQGDCGFESVFEFSRVEGKWTIAQEFPMGIAATPDPRHLAISS